MGFYTTPPRSDMTAIVSRAHGRESLRISEFLRITGCAAHARVDADILLALASGGYGETSLTRSGDYAHILDADPQAILDRHDLPPHVADVLRAAASVGRKVHVFPASRSICVV